MLDRAHRAFSEEDIKKIADKFHKWRSKKGEYEDIKGFCKSTTLEDIKKHKYILTPGQYVGIPDEVDDGIPFEEKMAQYAKELKEQMIEAENLDKGIKEVLKGIGFRI